MDESPLSLEGPSRSEHKHSLARPEAPALESYLHVEREEGVKPFHQPSPAAAAVARAASETHEDGAGARVSAESAGRPGADVVKEEHTLRGALFLLAARSERPG